MYKWVSGRGAAGKAEVVVSDDVVCSGQQCKREAVGGRAENTAVLCVSMPGTCIWPDCVKCR